MSGQSESDDEIVNGSEMEVLSCPTCESAKSQIPASASLMIQCDICDKWFHAVCQAISDKDVEDLDIFHCNDCASQHGASSWRSRRKSTRVPKPIYQSSYSELNEGIAKIDASRWNDVLKSRTFAKEDFPRVEGGQVETYVKNNGIPTPLLIPHAEGLNMTMPPSSLTVWDVAKLIGEEHKLSAMDVSTQNEVDDYTLGSFAEYFHDTSSKRERTINVLSLEVSNTALGEQIIRPSIVRKLDWTTLAWPSLKTVKDEWPKVQLYCLMSVAGCYTDFHIDFGGSSVFYHVISGSKVFYFIQPTDEHLRKYEQWTNSADQSSVFFADKAKNCFECHISAGQTLIIPSGWIHAVYTPVDTIVIGGNFLHGMSIEMQWRIYDIEERTRVPLKFRFPHFVALNWYAASYYLAKLETEEISIIDDTESTPIQQMELENILVLVKRLVQHSVSENVLGIPRELRQRSSEILRSLLSATLSKLQYPIDLAEKELILFDKIFEESQRLSSPSVDVKDASTLAIEPQIASDDNRSMPEQEKTVDDDDILDRIDLSHLADTDKVDESILKEILGSSSEDENIQHEKEEEDIDYIDQEVSQDEEEDDYEGEEEEEEDEEDDDDDEVDDEFDEEEEDDDEEIDSEDERNVKKRKRAPKSKQLGESSTIRRRSESSTKQRRSFLTAKKKANMDRDRSAPSEESSAEVGGQRIVERPLRIHIAMAKTRTEVIESAATDDSEGIQGKLNKNASYKAPEKPLNSEVNESKEIPPKASITPVPPVLPRPAVGPSVATQPRSLASLLSYTKNTKFTSRRR